MKTVTWNEIIENDKYRERVIKFYKLEMKTNASLEDFNERLEVWNKIDKLNVDKIKQEVVHDFNKSLNEGHLNEDGEFDFKLTHLLDEVAAHLTSTDGWKAFIENDVPVLSEYAHHSASPRKFYDIKNDGKSFVSLDLVSASWQTVSTIVGLDGSYNDYIKSLGIDYKIPMSTKYFRSVSTARQGQSKIMQHNKYLLLKNLNKILSCINSLISNVNPSLVISKDDIVAVYADEVIFSINDRQRVVLAGLKKALELIISKEANVDIHVDPFMLLNVTGRTFAKVNDNKEVSYKMISPDERFLIDKITHGFEIDEETAKEKQEFIKDVEEFLNKIQFW